MIVTAFTIKDEIIAGSMSLKDQLLYYNQVNGIALRSKEYPGLRCNARFKDTFCDYIQVFE